MDKERERCIFICTASLWLIGRASPSTGHRCTPRSRSRAKSAEGATTLAASEASSPVALASRTPNWEMWT